MEETLVHIKFDREEAKEYKREILHAQLSLLKVSRALKNFKESRLKELNKKLKIYQELKEMRRRVKSLEATLPKPKIPKILKEKEEKIENHEEIKKNSKNKTSKKEEKQKRIHSDEIESELLEIQRKLDSLK